MPELGNTSVFSQTDGSNDSGTMPSWSGTAAPSTLDNAGRALQGAVTREWNWRSYTLTAGGTANAKTLTYSVAPAAYYNGQIFCFIANAVNSSTATLNVNSVGAKSIKYVNSSGTLTALSGGEMVAGARVEVAYVTADDCFVWTNYFGAYATTTFTPTMDYATTGNLSVSYATQTGTYTRIQNLVHFSLYLVCTPTFTTASGAFLVKGLPLTAAASPASPMNYMGACLLSGWNSGGDDHHAAIAVVPGTTTARIRYASSSSFTKMALNSVAASDMTSAVAITLYASGQYMV